MTLVQGNDGFLVISLSVPGLLLLHAGGIPEGVCLWYSRILKVIFLCCRFLY